MALFNYGESIVVWSALPFGSHILDALVLLTGQKSSDASSYNVTHLIVPDAEHTMAAKSFKEKFPEIKILAMENVNIGDGIKPDYVVTEKSGNKVLDKSLLSLELGLTDPPLVDNFEFVYLPTHVNRELVAYEKNSKIVFEADLLFNLQPKNLEQFSTATGFSSSFNPHSGLSFLTRYLRPESSVGRYMFNKIVKSSDPRAKKGLQAIHLWNFDQMVMCHGNVIEHGARAQFERVFRSVL